MTRKTNETIRFKVEIWGKLSQENNLLYQVEIYSSRIPIRSKSNTIIKLGSDFTDFFDLDPVLTWTTCLCFDL